jgi:uncharacterized membrane protein
VPAQELFDLLFRWFHLIAGIMWIGNSMLFNWLDRNLEQGEGEKPGFQGRIWMVHSGGFYEVEKKLLAPNELPPRLHWFKWQNGFTWMSGIFLLVLTYYLHDGALLIDPRVRDLSQGQAVLLSLGLIVGSWLVYDVVWRFFGHLRRWPTFVTLGLLVAAAYVLSHTLSGRAAFMHVGVIIGTIMTGNVWTVILPSQRSLIAATREGKEQDVALGNKAKQRSIHNNYLTFPLLFIMLSQHFPSTWGDKLNWIVLLVIMAASAGVRLGMNLRYSFEGWWAVTAAFLVGGVLVLLRVTWHPEKKLGGPPVPWAEVDTLVGARCRPCHSSTGTDPLAKTVGGVHFDTAAQVQSHAQRIRERVYVLKTMPALNKTGMSDEERELIARWVDQGAKVE